MQWANVIGCGNLIGHCYCHPFSPVATVLIQHGTLKRGRYLVSGETWAKVKVMLGEGKSQLDSASLSQPVVLAGWKNVPIIGEDVIEVESEVGAEGRVSEDKIPRSTSDVWSNTFHSLSYTHTFSSLTVCLSVCLSVSLCTCMMQQKAKEVTSVRQLVQRRKKRQRQKQAAIVSEPGERQILPLVVKGVTHQAVERLQMIVM